MSLVLELLGADVLLSATRVAGAACEGDEISSDRRNNECWARVRKSRHDVPLLVL